MNPAEIQENPALQEDKVEKTSSPTPPESPGNSLMDEITSTQFDLGDSSSFPSEDISTDQTGEGRGGAGSSKSKKKSEQTQEEDKSHQMNDSEAIDKIAGMYVQTVDLFCSRLCAMAAGQNDNKPFKMSSDEIKSYKKVSAAYFETIDWRPSPTLIFVLFTGSLVGGNFWKAYAMRKDNIKTKKAESKASESSKKTSSKSKSGRPESRGKERGNFKTDSEGRYKYQVDESTNKWRYHKPEERTEYAPEYIVKWDREGKKSDEILELIENMNE